MKVKWQLHWNCQEGNHYMNCQCPQLNNVGMSIFKDKVQERRTGYPTSNYVKWKNFSCIQQTV